MFEISVNAESFPTMTVQRKRTELQKDQRGTTMKKVTIDAFYHYRFLSKVKITEDGEYAVFVQKKPDAEENCYESHLMRIRLSDGKITKINGEDVKSASVVKILNMKTTTVKISKTDINGTEISGAQIKITGRDGNDVADAFGSTKTTSWTSDGTVHEVTLADGDYTLVETGNGKTFTAGNGKKYYMSESGAMVTGRQMIDGKWYYFDESGAMR